MSQSKLFEQSVDLVPGGVHSPVRSFKGLHTTPLFFKSGYGAMITDNDGVEYIDFCMSFGPLVLGHKQAAVEKVLIEQVKKGWSYGACEPYSLELAQFLVESLPHVDQVRFVNSGTEAVMTALRLARGATGRSKIIKFNGCYHGHTDSMLIKAGSGLAGTAEASSAGVPSGVSDDTLILELADLDQVAKCFEDHKDQIAAIIIEPLPANCGLLPQDLNFLKGLRELTTKNKSLLIFDEVISGFRMGFKGMAEKAGINPDITTYGKVIGGGLPVGAIAGTREVMQNLAPVGNVYQAGTLSANPLAMVGGLATLRQLTPDFYKTLEENSKRICSIFIKWFAEYNNGEFSHYNIIREGSLFWLQPNNDCIQKACDIPADLEKHFYPLFETLLKKGVYLSPNAYEIGFVSSAHDSKIADKLEHRLWN